MTDNKREDTSQMVRSCLWKALLGTVQRPGVSFLGEAKGAYVNVVASAADVSELEQKVKLALDELGLDLIEMNDAEVLPLVLSKACVSEEVLAMAKTVRRLDSVAFGTFYVFDETADGEPANA